LPQQYTPFGVDKYLTIESEKTALSLSEQQHTGLYSLISSIIFAKLLHFLAYLSNVMNVLDKNKMQAYYLMMTMRQSTRRLRYVILLKVGIIDIFHRTLRF
jgi:hypothetical protein